jgi:hypothetical protein
MVPILLEIESARSARANLAPLAIRGEQGSPVTIANPRKACFHVSLPEADDELPAHVVPFATAWRPPETRKSNVDFVL